MPRRRARLGRRADRAAVLVPHDHDEGAVQVLGGVLQAGDLRVACDIAGDAHVLAAMGLAFREVGRPPEIHFGWSDESPMVANLNFLLFGEGNVPWLVRELIRKAEPNPDRQPRVVIG